MRIVLIYLLALGAVAAACYLGFPEFFGETAKANGGSNRKRAAPAVVLVKVKKAPFEDTLEALGTVIANESVSITANRSDHVSAIHFEDGQLVEKGEILLEMHSKEEKAMLREATSVRDDRLINHNRVKDLFDQQLTSARDFDTAKAELATAEARVLVLQAAIADRTIRAPFKGRLGLRQVSVGAFLQPSRLITTLDDLSIVKLDFTIPEAWLSFVEPGMSILATSSAWPAEEFDGKVATIDTRLDRRTRSVTIRALMPNPNHKLKPGMLLRVTIDRGRDPVLQVPEEALILSGDSSFVLCVDEKDVARRKKVEVGRRRVGTVEINQGLDEADRVVIEGIVRVDEGIVDNDKGIKVNIARVGKPKS